MARKSAKSPARLSVSGTLAVSDLRIRLEFLERDNQKLLGKIEKKRTELANFIDRIRELAVEVSQRSAPLLQQLLDLDRQLHTLFAEIFSGRKLGKQTRKSIELIYANLQAAGLISPCPNRPKHSQRDRSPDDERHEPDWEWGEQHSSTHFADESPKLDRDELKKIRQIFLKLAEVFHPDKVTDPEIKKYHNEVMQEINQAYQSGDLAKLLAIEQKHQMGEIIDRDNQDDLLRRCLRIEQENEYLKSQFENLKLELRLTKITPQGSMVTEYQKLSKLGCDPISEALNQTAAQIKAIAEVHQFVLDFRDRRITIKTFVQGPPIFQQMQDTQEMSEEELFLEFFGL